MTHDVGYMNFAGNCHLSFGQIHIHREGYKLTKDKRSLGYAVDPVDWVLGKNPVNLCMFEGKGSLNPPRYHHRYNAIPGHERGAVLGTVPNGFVRDMGMADRPGFDLSRGGNRSPSFRTSEPWRCITCGTCSLPARCKTRFQINCGCAVWLPVKMAAGGDSLSGWNLDDTPLRAFGRRLWAATTPTTPKNF